MLYRVAFLLALAGCARTPIDAVSQATTVYGPIVFVIQPPATVAAGHAFTVETALKNGNNVTMNVPDTVTLTLSPANGNLLGTTSKASSAGIAAFSGLSVQYGGTYTITATAPAGRFTTAISNTFTVTGAGPPMPDLGPPDMGPLDMGHDMTTSQDMAHDMAAPDLARDMTPPVDMTPPQDMSLAPPTKNLDHLRIMPLGDSITAGSNINPGGGYRIELEAQFVAQGWRPDFVGPNWNGFGTTLHDHEHAGFSGYYIYQIQAGVAQWVADAHPDIVLLMIGTNDIRGNADPNTTAQTYATLLDSTLSACESWGCLVYVCGIPPLGPTTYPVAAPNVATFNNAIWALVPSRPRARKALGGAVLSVSDLGTDDLHPASLAAYGKMADYGMWNSLETN